MNAAFHLAAAAPLAFPSGGGAGQETWLATDDSGDLKIALAVPSGWYLEEQASLAELRTFPEVRHVSEGTQSSEDFRSFLQRAGLDRRTSNITLRPLDPEVGPLHPRLTLPVTIYHPKRSAYYLAAADICDREINSKLRRVVVSVRDAATLKPVQAAVELDVKASAPEEILKPYLSGELLAQAVGRATHYARGKVRLEAKEETNPVTLYAPSTVNYKITAPGYDEAAGEKGRVERGPLLFLLKKKLVE